MRVGVYARVSTKDQNCAMQLEALRGYCQNRGFEIVREFVDHGFSGSKDSRPALNELMAWAHERKIDAVVVWKFDRFARSVKHLVSALETFNDIGISFISFSEHLDTSTSMGKAMFAIIAAMAQLERDLIRERVSAGVHRAMANGKAWGRRKIQFNDLPHLSLRKAASELGVSIETVRRRRMSHAGETPCS